MWLGSSDLLLKSKLLCFATISFFILKGEELSSKWRRWLKPNTELTCESGQLFSVSFSQLKLSNVLLQVLPSVSLKCDIWWPWALRQHGRQEAVSLPMKFLPPWVCVCLDDVSVTPQTQHCCSDSTGPRLIRQACCWVILRCSSDTCCCSSYFGNYLETYYLTNMSCYKCKHVSWHGCTWGVLTSSGTSGKLIYSISAWLWNYFG